MTCGRYIFGVHEDLPQRTGAGVDVEALVSKELETGWTAPVAPARDPFSSPSQGTQVWDPPRSDREWEFAIILKLGAC